MRIINIIIASVFAIFGFFILPLKADVSVKKFYKTSGYRGFGGFESNETEHIKRTSKRIDAKKKYTGKVMNFFSGEKKTSRIIIVPKNRQINIYHKEKEYSVQKITLPEEQEEKGGEKGYQKDKADKRKYRVIKNQFKVKNTGKRKTINGFRCTLYEATWTVITEHVETKERKTSVMNGSFWNTTKNSAIRKYIRESTAFNRSYMRKVGIDIPPGQMSSFGLHMMAGMMGTSGKSLSRQLKKLKGFSIISEIVWKSGTSGGKKKNEKSSSGGLTGLFTKFVKDKATGDNGKGELKKIFDAYNEIREIRTKAVPASYFQVPEGYKKK